MAAIKIEAFDGVSPRTGPALLGPSQAQAANNIKLQSGELRAWRKPLLTQVSPVANTATIYKLNGPAGQSAWLTWATDVDCVTSPVADLADYRIYFTGSGTPKKSNWAMATSGTAKPTTFLEMGVPSPTAAPTLAASGGTTPAEVRAYVYTFVSTFGAIKEESAPSPAALVTANVTGSTVTVSGLQTAPAGLYNVTHLRIYRSVTGTTSTIYLQVAELAIGTTTYSDTVLTANLGPSLTALNYTPPPATLAGLVSMPNGMLAGFTGNQVWFCEPYLPHAWPANYVLTTEFPIVGLGVYGTSLVVTTTKNPYLITGSNPSVMTQEKLSMTQACVSKRSIASTQTGVVYASPYGMVTVGYGQTAASFGTQEVSTTGLITPDEWQPINPSSLIGTMYGNFYMGFYNNGTRNGIVLAEGKDSPAMTSFSFPASAVYVDRSSGALYACSALDNTIYQIDADPINSTSYEWLSKKFVLPAPVNFAALAVNADFVYMNDKTAISQALQQYNTYNTTQFTTGMTTGVLGGEMNGAAMNSYPWNGSSMLLAPALTDLRTVQAIVFADGVQVFSTPVTSIEPVRMPAGFKAYNWEVMLAGNAPVRSFTMATTMKELKSV